MKRKITFLSAALMLLAFLAVPLGMWGQSDYSTDYTGNITLSITGGSNATTCVINISNVLYDGIKAGTSKNAGAVKITVPSGTKYLHLHAAAWNNNSCSLAVTPGGYSENIGLTANSGIANNSPFTFNGDPSTEDYYKVITFTSALGEDTDLTFTATGGKRFVIWGVTSEEEGSAPSVATPTFNPANGTTFGDGGLEVTISCATDNTTIYYTLDGSDPDDESTEYTSAISLTTTTTIKAIAYDGDDNTSAVATATYTYVDPNAPGTENNPYTVAQAIANTPSNGNVYIQGIVSSFYNGSIMGDGSNFRYYISEDGTTTTQLLVYKGKGLNNEAFTSNNDLLVGDEVVIYGSLVMYQNAPEIASGNYLYSWNRPAVAVEAPTFSPAAGAYAETQTVTISCATADATIYYTIDGTEPSNQSNVFDQDLSINSTTTIKAIAIKGSDASTVATATYHIANSASNPYSVYEALNFYEYPTPGIYVHGIVSTAPTQDPTNNGELTYFISIDGEATNELEVYKGKGLEQAAFTSQDDIQVGDIVTIYGNVQIYNSIIEFASGNYLVDFERPASTEPSITVNPVTVSVDAGEHEESLAITLQNIEVTDEGNFEIYFYESDGTTVADYSEWLDAEVIPSTNEGYEVYCTIQANTSEARHAYLKVYVLGDDSNEATSDLITINQDGYVAPPAEYATLPFEFDGGRADIESTDGLTQEGLDTDYASSPKLKFKTTGTWVVLHFNERPGTLTFDIKGNSFSGGTFTVQTSEDGVTYTDLENYTDDNFGNTVYSEEFTNLDENVRYIKWIYTEKSSGNVGLGNIALSTPVSAITLEQYAINVEATSGDGMITVEYTNIDELDPHVQLYDAEGAEVEPEYYDWISVNLNGTVDDNVHYGYDANTDTVARTVYFKVYNDEVYSDMVTITQAAYVAPGSITVAPDTLNVDAEQHLVNYLDIEYNNIVVENTQSFTVHYYDAEGEEIELIPGEAWMIAGVVKDTIPDANYQVVCMIIANEGEARTAYFKVSAQDANDNTVYSNLVTINQEAYVAPVVEEAWVLTNLADLTENDVFVIVGDNGDTYAMSNNNGTESAPSAVSVTVVDETLSGEIPATIQWNISGNANDGYVFYPNGDTENWLYCTSTNNGVRVGSGDANTFSISDEGYLVNDGTSRYIGIYNSQDWRCYTSINSNIANQTFAFYKKPQPSVTVTPNTINAPAEGADGYLALAYENITDFMSFDYYFCDAEGNELQEDPDWIVAEINVDSLYYLINANDGEARTAYFKVYTFAGDDLEEVYDIVTITQEAAPQQYTLTVEPFENLEIITFVNDEMVMEGDGEIQVNEGDTIMLSVVALDGYEMETLLVNGVDHVNDIAEDFTYTFDMPAENVTISATAVESVAPAGAYYVRITSLDQLTDESKVIIAARYDEEHTNGYYAMENTTSGKPTGVAFTSEASGDDEILPEDIISSEDTYYWTVNVTNDGYTFTNANNQMIGYTSGTNFATGGNNTEWTITRETAAETTMVAEYTGFVIRNGNTNTRAFAFNGQAFGAYATSNMTSSQASGYNFFLDFFVQSEAPATETHILTINGYTDDNSKAGYYLIASPVTVDPANVEGMTEDDFDLYYFDQAEDLEWINYETEDGINHFNLVPGKGYLYAKKATTEISTYNFTLTGVPYDGDGEIELTNTTGAEFEGWNLVGNPFGVEAEISMDYYALTPDATELIPTEASTNVAPMQGVFVQYTNEAQTVIFTPVEVTDVVTSAKSNDAKVVLNVTHNRGNVIDRAIIRFGEGRQLSKFQLNPNHTKVYFPQGENDYAIVRSANEGEMPVSFKAENNGTYTFSVNAENVEMTYLHLIDNMTGTDVDLLATPSYSFEAKTTDYASRFRLVFNANTVNENGNETFAYYNGNEWVISNMGEATLQVVDLMGRVLSTETVNGNVTMNINQTPGVYMLRLVNGDSVKVQKVVVR